MKTQSILRRLAVPFNHKPPPAIASSIVLFIGVFALPAMGGLLCYGAFVVLVVRGIYCFLRQENFRMEQREENRRQAERRVIRPAAKA